VATKKYFTTGEVAKLLDISRSTVMRKFDKGIFRGKKNPITGERMVSRESLDAFMKQYNLSWNALAIEKLTILLVSADAKMASAVQRAFADDESFKLERVEFGCDALYLCSKERPELMIIDESLPDIPASDVVKSLKRVDDHKDLKIICCVADEGSMPEWAQLGIDECLTKDSLDEATLSKKVCRILNILEESEERAQFEHKRRSPRLDLNVPAKIAVYPLTNPRQASTGRATVRNLSMDGAFLSPIQLDAGVIPGEPFRISLQIEEGPLSDFKADCKVVRLQSNGSLMAGIQFVSVPDPSAKKISEFLNA